MDDEIEVVVPETTEEEIVVEEETIEDVRAKLAKAEEIAENQKIRAEKAEKRGKIEKHDEQSLSTKDTFALMNARVSSDDIDEVLRVAKILGKSVSDALKDKTLQSILTERVDERNTAAATQTGKTQRGVTKTTGEDLLSKAEQTGEVPDTAEGMQSIFLARQARKFSK